MKLSLFEMSEEYAQAFMALADSDMPDECINDTLEGLEGALNDKCINIAAFIRNLHVSADAIKQSIESQQKRIKSIENKASRLEEYLLNSMLKTGLLKIESPWFDISVRNNPPSVSLDDISILPVNYWRYYEAPAPTPDKMLIAKALKEGYAVPGCSLVSNKSLSIK